MFRAHVRRGWGWRGLWDVRISCWAVWILNAIKHLWQEIPCWSPVTFPSLPFPLPKVERPRPKNSTRAVLDLECYWNIMSLLVIWNIMSFFVGSCFVFLFKYIIYLLIDHLTTILICLSGLWNNGQFPELCPFSSDWTNFYLSVQFTHIWNLFEESKAWQNKINWEKWMMYIFA